MKSNEFLNMRNTEIYHLWWVKIKEASSMILS